jgi:hypothetical protein
VTPALTRLSLFLRELTRGSMVRLRVREAGGEAAGGGRSDLEEPGPAIVAERR